MNRWYELARTGTFKDRFGKVYNVTKEILQRIAEQYKPETFKAPITVGHPETATAPSWGFVDAVKVQGDKLLFRPGRLVAEFAEMVNKGLYTNVSAGFSLPDWSLNHVAFLGGVAPAIKGLEQITNVEFSAPIESIASLDVSDSAGWVGTAEFSAERDSWVERQFRTISRVLKRLREQKIEVDGLEKANALINEWELEDLGREPPKSEALEVRSEFSTGEENDMTLEQKVADAESKAAEFASKITLLETEIVGLKNENLSLKRKDQEREFAEFCDGLVLQGRLPADQKGATVKFMLSLDNATKVEFAEGVQATALETYKEQLKRSPVLVEFSEIATFSKTGSARDENCDKYSKLGKEIAAAVNS